MNSGNNYEEYIPVGIPAEPINPSYAFGVYNYQS